MYACSLLAHTIPVPENKLKMSSLIAYACIANLEGTLFAGLGH